MTSYIGKDGNLTINPENSTEYYALKRWVDENEASIENAKMIIGIDRPKKGGENAGA